MSETEKIVDVNAEPVSAIDVEAIKKQYDSESRFRLPQDWSGTMINVLAVAMSCFHLYTAATGLLMEMWQRSIHLCFVLVLVFLLYPIKGKNQDVLDTPTTGLLGFIGFVLGIPLSYFFQSSLIRSISFSEYLKMIPQMFSEQSFSGPAIEIYIACALCALLMGSVGYYVDKANNKKISKDRIPWYDYTFAVLGAFVTLYMVFQFHAMLNRSGMPNILDLTVGCLGILLVLEATRRVSNPVLPVIAIFFLFYCYFGRYMPALFQHRGYNFYRIINHMYLGTEGVFGTPLSVSATFVFMFVLFGTIIEQTGLGKYIIDLSMALAGWSAGGPAKVAVVSSGIMGTISGSSVANVCTTGMFTIPLMKSVGYQSHFAGAVEAVASTGGQIMPPVMGAAAFIMAQTMGISYLDVALAAIVPALLYYVAVIVQVHFEATRLGLVGLPRDRLPKLKALIFEKGHLLLPLVGIIYFLVAGYTPLKAAYYGILLTIVTSYFKRDTWLTPAKLWEGLVSGARSSLGVACACATVGIVIGTATLTGLGLKLAHAIVTLAGGSLLLTLIFTMFASILLGMGLPTTANFIVTSTMAAPALIQLGIPPMAAYMFVLYFGIAADLTPPVALAAYAGAGIANADPIRTGITACKLALAGFLVPYIYAYNPILVLENFEAIEFAQAAITAIIGVFLLGMATIGFYKAHVNWLLRILALAGALGLMIPGWKSDLAGLAILVFIHFWQTAKGKKILLA